MARDADQARIRRALRSLGVASHRLPCWNLIYRLDGDGYRLVVTRGGTDTVRLEPFGAVELELEALWPTPPIGDLK